MCGSRFQPDDNITVYVGPKNISSVLSANSEASALELLENLEEMFP